MSIIREASLEEKDLELKDLESKTILDFVWVKLSDLKMHIEIIFSIS